MKSRAYLAAVILAVLCALPTLASAAFTHYFNCEKCHRSGAAWGEVASGGICIDCHSATSNDTTFNGATGRPLDGATLTTLSGQFAAGDASNALGSNPAASGPTSHNWGATGTNPAAGATPPSAAMYAGGSSYGKVTCYGCHDPHATFTNDPDSKLLRSAGLPAGDGTDHASEANVEAMCVECHKDWSAVGAGENALLSHPVIDGDYLTTYKNDPRFKTDGVTANTTPYVANGDMTLLAGNKIGCTTCHGTHFVDSNAATADGLLAGEAVNGDGKLLKGSGVLSDATKTALCTSCHVYTAHPSSSGMPFGCLDCHSGHSYNGGTPNNFILRDQVAIPALSSLPTKGTTVTGIVYDNLAMTPKDRFLSYCTKCHGAVTSTAPGGISENQPHTGLEDCSTCHEHGKTFAGGNCVSCHGYAPKLNVDGSITEGGYAHSLSTPANNYSTAGAPIYKNEALTPHDAHYTTFSISCDKCHGDNPFASPNHDTGSFQNVLNLAAPSALPALTTNSGALSPTYNTAGAGTCNAVYCHSNGVTGVGYADAAPTWALQAGSIVGTPTECQSCHGNDVASMTSKTNSAAHLKHVARYSCNVCHNDTTDNSTAIANLALHVNANVELSYDNTASIGFGTVGTGTASAAGCTVYCHSNGGSPTALKVNSTPVWGTLASGACGTCHQYSNAGVATGTGAALGGAHAKHLYDATGPKAACDACHTNVGTGADHVNGQPSLKADACLACHGAVASGTGYDSEPVWGAASITCDNCHRGVAAVINTRTAPLKNGFDNGHGKAGVARVCTDCHDPAGAGHLDATAGDNRLRSTLEVYSATDDRAFCGSCHTVIAAQNHNTIDGTVCQTCHAPHGEVGNTQDAMMRTLINGTYAVTGFSAQGVRTSYVNAARTGICQTCHGATTKYFNATLAFNDAGHKPGQPCSDCHTHDSNPAFAGKGDSCDACHDFPPQTGAHVKHAPDSAILDAAGVVDATADMTACAYCHTGADSYTYIPGDDIGNGLNHSDPAGRVTILENPVTSIGYDSADGSCASACHLADNTRADWRPLQTTGLFSFPTACDACHDGLKTNATTIGSGSHTGHLSSTAVNCDSCHDTVPADTAHIDIKTGGTELARVQNAAQALPDEAFLTLTAFTFDDGLDSCSAVVCHNDGFNGTPGSTPVWGAAPSCSICHLSDMTNGSHTTHLAAGATCGNCHDGAVKDSTAPAEHADGNVDVYDAAAGDLGYPTTAAYGNSSWTSCSTASCHRAGQSATLASDYTATPNWGFDAPKCSECHAASPTTNAHGKHIAVTGDCATCHTGAIKDTSYISAEHRDLNVDVAVGGYAPNKALGSAVGTCSNISCHGDGFNPGGGNTPAWNLTAGCGACHLAAPTTGSHGKHLTDTGGSCTPCHDDADPATSNAPGQHGDGNIDVYNTTAGDLGYLQDRAVGSASWTTCNAASCHDNGTGTLVTTPQWGQVTGCTECHTTVPSTGAHTKHLTTTITNPIACTDCHSGAVWGTTATTTGHRNGNVDVTVGSYPAVVAKHTDTTYSSCSTSYCHGDAMPRGTTSGVTNAPNWGGTSTGCGYCHAMAPLAIGAHAGVTAAQCITCHDHVNAAGDGFTDATLHINGTLEGGGDNCLDCHSSLSARHAIHSDPATILFGKTVSGGDYGTAWFYDYSVRAGGLPNAGCGQCHPSTVGTHMNSSVNLDLTPGSAPGGNIKTKNNATVSVSQATGTNVTCSSVYCHSDGQASATFATSPNWFGGTFAGDKCTNCHGNWPNSNAHEAHQVGIHFREIYAGATGGLLGAPAASGNVAHGTTNLSTISCQTCHNNTVTTRYNDLATNSTANGCSSCHGTTNPATIAGTSTTHVNGTADVAFEGATFKSKAQVRNTFAAGGELDNSWTRGTYKVDANSLDTSKAALSTAVYNSGSCSAVACHNGNTATWTDTGVTCMSCHNELP